MDEKKDEKKVELKIEELEERIAPIVHGFSPGGPAVGVFDIGTTTPCFVSSGAAGGNAAFAAVTGTDPITGVPIPANTPGVGP